MPLIDVLTPEQLARLKQFLDPEIVSILDAATNAEDHLLTGADNLVHAAIDRVRDELLTPVLKRIDALESIVSSLNGSTLEMEPITITPKLTIKLGAK